MAEPPAEWEESDQSCFEVESEAFAKRNRQPDISSQNLQREHEVLEAGHEMSCGEVRETEHAVTYRIIRIKVHEAVEGVNGCTRPLSGKVGNSRLITVTPPCRGLNDLLDRVGEQRDVLSRRNDRGQITRPLRAQIEAHGPHRAFLAARPSGCRRLRFGTLEPRFNAGGAAPERTGGQSQQTEPAQPTAEDALQRLIVARADALPRLTASPAGDDEDGSRSGRHVDARSVAVASGAAAATAGAKREAERAQNAVRGYRSGEMGALAPAESRPTDQLTDNGHHATARPTASASVVNGG